MKKYSFRLGNVRRVRMLQEEVAKAALINANLRVQMAQRAIDAALLHYSDITGGSVCATGGQSFMKHRYRVELASRCVVEARRSKSAAEAEARVAHMTWSDAARRVKALDRLDQNARDEYRIEFERELDKEIDEINVSRAAKPVTA